MEVRVKVIFLDKSLDVRVFADSKQVDDFQAMNPSLPQVAGNAVEIIFSDAAVNKCEGVPIPLMNATMTLQGRLGNHQDIRSPEAESEVMNAAQALASEYISVAVDCTISKAYLRVAE